MDLGKSFNWSTDAFNRLEYAIGASGTYLTLVLLHRFLFPLKNVPKVGDFLAFQKIHNVILSLGSLLMFVGCLYEVRNRYLRENTAVWLLCEYESTPVQGSLYFWSYVYYLSKYYELLDTVLQLLQGKIPPNYALHVFHHCIVILIDWWWLSSGASIQFIGLLFNTFVHVVMYYYFYLKSTGVNPWWKKWVTTLQIVQFMTSGVCFLVTLFLHYGLNSRCKGMEAVFASLLFNAVLLYGFVDVLNKTNKSARSNKSIKRSE